VGATITTSSSSLQTATFSLNETGNVRFQIRKTSGGANRINIDDFIISGSGSSGSGGSGGSGGTDTGGSSSSTADNSNLLLGNPSAATSSITDSSNYLIDQTYYTESYNRDKGTPNWVSWYIGSSSLGSASRQDDFRADTNLPSGWYQVQSTSYSGSGFDRGHNCPSADRTSTTTANSATFLMDNMIPQAPNNNQGTWANMENYIRSLVTSGNEVYVVMGSYGTGGTGSNGTFNTIDNGHVNVPSHVWKVVVVMPNGSGDISRISTSTRVIAVDTPNSNTVNSDWTVYKTSVDAIEAATGYNLLSNVPASVQVAIEAQVDH
jgi:endonuclease G